MKDDPPSKHNSIFIGIALSVAGLGLVDHATGYELDVFTLLSLDDRGNMDGEPHQFMLDFDFSYEKIISKPTTKGST